MKLFITLFILTLSCVSVGQTKMTLYLKDGTIKNGYGKRKNQDIIFSNTKKDEAVKYELKTIDSIYCGNERKPKIYHIVEGWGKNYNMAELYKRGKKMDVYIKESSSSSMYGKYNFTSYSIKRHEETELADFGDGNLWDSFKNRGSKYFEDCPELAENIKNGKKGFRKADLKDIADFYNSKCN